MFFHHDLRISLKNSLSQCHCGKLFKKKSSLNAHKSTHSTAIFQCYCGAVFRCEQYLKNHKRRKHLQKANEQGEPEDKRSRRSLEVDGEEFEAFAEKEMLNESPFDPMDLLKMQMNDGIIEEKEKTELEN